jgi:hypothetical protein
MKKSAKFYKILHNSDLKIVLKVVSVKFFMSKFYLEHYALYLHSKKCVFADLRKSANHKYESANRKSAKCQI